MCLLQVELLDELAHLSALPKLSTVNLEGNPIASLPFYRALAIFHLPASVNVLDNKTVTPAERAAAGDVVMRVNKQMDVMMYNELELRQLDMVRGCHVCCWCGAWAVCLCRCPALCGCGCCYGWVVT
mgnify:CR=1 FL=1